MATGNSAQLLRLSLAVLCLNLLNGCVTLLPSGGGVQARMSQYRPPDHFAAFSPTPPGVEELSSNIVPREEATRVRSTESAVIPSPQAAIPEPAAQPQTVALLDNTESPKVPAPPAAEAAKPRPVPEKGKVTVIPARPGEQYESLWERLADGFDLDDKSNAHVKAALAQYQRHPRATRNLFRQARTYLWEITEAVESRGLPMELALLPAIESRFNPMAQSHRRALGLWQFMPGTANHLGLEQNWWFDARLDVAESTQAALDYLEYLYARFQDWPLALAAYNCGEARLQRAIDAADGNTDFWELSLPEETRQYVPKLLALAVLVEDPEDYGLRLPALPNQQATDTVLFDRQVDLALVAQHSDIDLQTLQYLNPGLLRWATPPGGPHRLRVPAGKSEKLQEIMPAIPTVQWANWQTYLVREGDSLSEIAKRFGIRTADLKSVNGLQGSMIRSGQSLVLPSGVFQAPPGTSRMAEHTPPADAVRVEYLVKSGDTLWDIAHRFRVSIEALSSWNGLHSGSILRPGKKLVVWVANEHRNTLTDKLAKG